MMDDHRNEAQAIALDTTKLLGYWLLQEERVTRIGRDGEAIHLKMGNNGKGKFFGGTAGIRPRPA